MLADNCSSFNTNHPTANSIEIKHESIEVSRILRAVFKKTEKLLISIKKKEGTARSKKINLMTSLKTMQILYGRFLALYRWNMINQSRSVNSREISRRIAENKRTLANFQIFAKQYLQMKIPLHIFHKKFDQNLFSPVKIKSSPFDIATRLVQVSSSLFQNEIIYSNHVLNIFKRGEYFFQLHISSYGKCRLKSFKVQWPKKVIFQTQQFLLKYSSILSNIAANSPDPITECSNILHKLYQIGKFLKIYMILQIIQSKNLFQLTANQDGAIITFPKPFAPNNVFTISILDKDIILVSKNPMNMTNTKEKRFISFILTPNRYQIESVISSICISTYFTRLSKIWGLINQGLTTISWKHQFRGEFNELSKSIEIFLFNFIIMRIKIESTTGNIDINTFGGIGMDPHDFITAIEGCECQRNEAIKIVFHHSLSRIVFSDQITSQIQFNVSTEEPIDQSTRCYKLSYSKDSQIVFGEKLGHLSLSILSSDGSNVSTPEIMMINSESDGLTDSSSKLREKTIKATQSAKMAALILQLFKTLRDRGIAARNENGRVHFILDPFECVEFQINQYSTWSLKFVKPSIGFNDLLSLNFVGNSINARFVDWILHIVWSVSDFMLLLKQSMGIASLHTIIQDLDIENKTRFTIQMTKKFCSKLTVSIDNLRKLKSEPENEVYYCNTLATPQINFSFSRYIQLKRYLESILKNNTIEFLFGSFLSSSFVPLQHFSNVFTGDPNNKKWSITDLSIDDSFFLIFQREMSINFNLKPAQFFQFIIPPIGKSNVLQIPIESLSITCHLTKISHPTWKLHMQQLEQFKNSIERFFHFRQLLGEVGFRYFSSNGQELYSPFMVDIQYVSITCFIKPDRIEFEAEGSDADIAKYIKTLLNYDFGDVKTQMLAIRFVRNLVSFDQMFVGLVMMFIAKLIEKTSEFRLLWKATFESSAVMLNENKVIFNLYTEHGSSCIEFDRRDGNLNPEIIGYSKSGNITRIKSMRDLFRWMELIEQEDISGEED